VLFAAGAALLFLGLCLLMIDRINFLKWATPFLVFVRNPISAYASSSILADVMNTIPLNSGGQVFKLKSFAYSR